MAMRSPKALGYLKREHLFFWPENKPGQNG